MLERGSALLEQIRYSVSLLIYIRPIKLSLPTQASVFCPVVQDCRVYQIRWHEGDEMDEVDKVDEVDEADEV